MYKHAYVKELLLLNFKNKYYRFLIGSDDFDIKNGDSFFIFLKRVTQFQNG